MLAKLSLLVYNNISIQRYRDLKMETQTTQLTLVNTKENKRLDFLPSKFNNSPVFLRFENMCFDLADKYIDGYTQNGSFWDFVETEEKSNIWFMSPRLGEVVKFNAPSGYFSGETRQRAIGFAITVMALNHLTWQLNSGGNQELLDLVMDQYENVYGGTEQVGFSEEELNSIYNFLD